MVQRKLKEWVAKERKTRHWSIRELAERTNSPHSSIRRAFVDDERVGIEVCLRLAKAFNKPVYEVLEMAEWVPKRPEETRLSMELMHLFDQLTIDKQHDLIDYTRYLLQK